MSSDDSLISLVLERYFPDWEPPADTGSEWISCLCPVHSDSNPSASVSYGNDAFRCFTCDYKGNALTIIMREEKVGFKQAVAIAEGLSEGSSDGLLQSGTRKPGRRVFGDSGDRPRDNNQVRPGLRRRTPPGA